MPLLILMTQIFWSDSGELVCIATEESFFILKYLSEKVASAQETHEGVTEDGIEDAFEVSVFKNGIWPGSEITEASLARV